MQSSAIKGSKCAENPDDRPGPGKGKSMQKLLTWRNGRRSRHRCEFITRKQATIPASQSPTKCSNISKCRRFKCFWQVFTYIPLSLLYSLHRPIFLFFQHQKFIIRIDAIVVLAFILIVSPSSGLISAYPAQILLNGRRSIIQVDTSVQCSVLRGS